MTLPARGSEWRRTGSGIAWRGWYDSGKHGLTVSQFDYWKRQVRREGARGVALDFAPVHIIDADPVARVSACVEVQLRDGERLVIHEGASVDLVRTLLTALRASC